MIDAVMVWYDTHQALTLWLAGLSTAIFALSLLSLPFLAARIPEDYFCDEQRQRSQFKGLHPLAYLLLRVCKNLLGWLLVVAGLIMLVLPGQGLLTILMGLMLSDFPGKFALERRLVSNPKIWSAINWLRARRGQPPLRAPSP